MRKQHYREYEALQAFKLRQEVGLEPSDEDDDEADEARPAQLGSWEIPKVPPRLKCDILCVKPSAQTHIDAPHCSSHCHQLHVF